MLFKADVFTAFVGIKGLFVDLYIPQLKTKS